MGIFSLIDTTSNENYNSEKLRFLRLLSFDSKSTLLNELWLSTKPLLKQFNSLESIEETKENKEDKWALNLPINPKTGDCCINEEVGL